MRDIILIYERKNILTDNNPFADAWGYWCFLSS